MQVSAKVSFFRTASILIFLLAISPFADIVLLSANSATAIVVQVILALVFLNEVFICKFDLPALLLILLGSWLIIHTANFSDVELTVSIIKDNLCSFKSIVFFGFTFCLLNVIFWIT